MKKIFTLSFVFLFYISQVFADNLNDSNLLFDWVQSNYANCFSPKNSNTYKLEGYLIRYYEDTNTYIGTINNDVYVYGDIFNGLMHVGKISDYISPVNNTNTKNIKLMFGDEFSSEDSTIQPYNNWYLGSNQGQTTLNNIYSGNGKLIFVNKLNAIASQQQFWLFIEQ